MEIPFVKAHGAGNDFVIIDKSVDFISKSKKIIKFICDRHFGIGCDQLILLKKVRGLHQIQFYNSDGSLGKNCGNGLDDFIHLFAYRCSRTTSKVFIW